MLAEKEHAHKLIERLGLGQVAPWSTCLRFPGVAMQSVGLTFGTALCMLTKYRSGLIRNQDCVIAGVPALYPLQLKRKPWASAARTVRFEPPERSKPSLRASYSLERH